MSNLLKQAIDCGDGEQAAKIIQRALGIESNAWWIIAFRKSGRMTASNVPASLASGYEARFLA